jgi:ferredoxin
MAVPVVDQELCIGCGVCVEICPEVFELGEDEKSHVTDAARCDTCDCEEAADSCPVSAIDFEE